MSHQFGSEQSFPIPIFTVEAGLQGCSEPPQPVGGAMELYHAKMPFVFSPKWPKACSLGIVLTVGELQWQHSKWTAMGSRQRGRGGERKEAFCWCRTFFGIWWPLKTSMSAKWDIIKLQENTMNTIFYGIQAHPCQRRGNATQYLQDNMNSCIKDQSWRRNPQMNASCIKTRNYVSGRTCLRASSVGQWSTRTTAGCRLRIFVSCGTSVVVKGLSSRMYNINTLWLHCSHL